MTTDNTPYDNLDKHLTPLAGSIPGMRLLEINPRGPGRALWFLEHVLPLIGDRYISVGEVDERFRQSLAPQAEYVVVLDGPTVEALAGGHSAPRPDLVGPERVDIIYLNRCRDSDVLQSLIEYAWNALRPGGVLIVEEYRTHRGRYQYIGRIVDRFLTTHEHQVIFESNEKGVRKPA